MFEVLNEEARQRRDEWFAGKRCAHCDSTEDLQLDHVDPATKSPQAGRGSLRIWSWSDARREAELALCQPLCGRCHRRKTAAERRKPLKHGTAYAYQSRRCRCPVCREWASANWQRYKAAHL